MDQRAKIRLEGIVQGVGFRPFIHRLSRRFALSGFVANTSSGVEIEAEGAKNKLINFYRAIQQELPSLARITKRKITFAPAKGYAGFSIRESKNTSLRSALVSPDIATCPACRKELFSSSDRRYRYPFINCTDCGPRFSIIQGLPYDRGLTTMKKFRICPACKKEYDDIAARRYHAQPNACAVCGPRVSLIKAQSVKCKAQNLKHKTQSKGNKAIIETIRLLKRGRILAIKGIGGFHLACDAYNPAAIRKLRRKKSRPYKPLAVMAADIKEARKICLVSKQEKALLLSPECPIVLLRKKTDSPFLELLAPQNNYLGVMLPYAPLQHLLFSKAASKSKPLRCLVMTSGNLADQPIEIENAAAIKNLSFVCSHFLVHDRDIYNRADDSIVQVIDKKAVVLRRGRGYSPFPFFSAQRMRQILGSGAELKNTFCLSKNKCAFVSQYIGDLKTYPTFDFYKEALRRLCSLFDLAPKIIACDLHPDYLSSAYAQELKSQNAKLKVIPVQHHQAHLASVIAEHRIKEKVIGICFDGIGLGSDGKIWGGEIFTGDLKGFSRAGHLEYAAMPGLDKATQEPYRMAISYLDLAFREKLRKLKLPFLKRHKAVLENILRLSRTSPILTSSIGRLFDAVSALLGICDIITFEAEAAIRLQMQAERSRSRKGYHFVLENKNREFIIRTGAVIRRIVKDIVRKVPKEEIARKFHNAIAGVTLEICRRLRKKTGINSVAVSGGVFQNKLLLETLLKSLRRDRFKVYYNQLLPTNDAAVSLGQVAIANEKNKHQRRAQSEKRKT